MERKQSRLKRTIVRTLSDSESSRVVGGTVLGACGTGGQTQCWNGCGTSGCVETQGPCPGWTVTCDPSCWCDTSETACGC